MQDPATFPAMKPPFPEQEQLKCPRCDSTNTKFCYYNNYNLSQPRHFCKNCRRYWTKGGALRNIPIGGGTRKNSKRSSNPKSHHRTSSPSSSSSSRNPPPPPPQQQPKSEPTGVGPYAPSPEIERDRRMMEVPGSFSSLLASSGQFGHFFEGLNPGGGSGTVDLGGFAEADTGRVGDPVLELQSTANAESFLGFQPGNGGDSSCWGGGGGGGGGAGNGWPDLSIYTPGSTYQ